MLKSSRESTDNWNAWFCWHPHPSPLLSSQHIQYTTFKYILENVRPQDWSYTYILFLFSIWTRSSRRQVLRRVKHSRIINYPLIIGYANWKWTHQRSQNETFGEHRPTCSDLSTNEWSINWRGSIIIARNHNWRNFAPTVLVSWCLCVSSYLFITSLTIPEWVAAYQVNLLYQVLSVSWIPSWWRLQENKARTLPVHHGVSTKTLSIATDLLDQRRASLAHQHKYTPASHGRARSPTFPFVLRLASNGSQR